MTSSHKSRAERIATERTDALFQKRRIGDIRSIEKATLAQIEEKKNKLKGLVGESFKDVIHSADAILEMSQATRKVLLDLKTLKTNLRLPKNSKQDTEGGDDYGLYAMACRVKYLVDSHEVIWSCLDSGEFVEAARRLLRGELVYDRIQKFADKRLKLRFPVLEDVWPGIAQLRSQIVDQVRQHVAETGEMTGEDSQYCLAAMAILKPSDSTELIRTFLRFRKLSVVSVVTEVAGDLSPVERLCRISRLLLSTVVHLVKVELKSVLAEDLVGYSGLLFGVLGEESESKVWKDQLKQQSDRFNKLAKSEIGRLIEEWLQEVAHVVQDSAEGLLISCTTLPSLLEVEKTVKGLLSDKEWQGALEEIRPIEVDIWKTVFESLVRQKCLSIVSASFASASSELQSRLHEILQEVKAQPVEELSEIRISAWKLKANKDLRNPKSEVVQLVDEFDRKLGAILVDVMSVLGLKERPDGDRSPTGSVKHGSVRSFSMLSGTHRSYFFRKTDRSIELESKIQSLWEDTAIEMANSLELQFSSLPEENTVDAIEATLLISMVALGLAEHCPSVGILAGPAEEWLPPTGLRSARSSVKGDIAAPLHLSNAFKNVAFVGITRWIDWSINRLVSRWSLSVDLGELTGDEDLQVVTISHQAIELTEDTQMSFSIPSGPSQQTMQLLIDTAIEIQRIGQYSTQVNVVRCFQFTLETSAREALRKRVKEGSPENYVLQLLMDFRFIRDVCSSGEPVPKFDADVLDLQRSLSAVPEDALSITDTVQRPDPAVKRAVVESQNQSKRLEADLSDLLDPIDWATYEPHLWNTEARSYKRTQILFGSLGLSSKPLHDDVPIKLPPGISTNCLHAAPIAPRFQYLPVRHTNYGDKNLRGGVPLIYASLVEIEEDPRGNYSFSDLIQSQGNTSLPTEEEASSFLSLGSMFTYKAAEVTQRFGDYLQPTGGIFSSLTRKVNSPR